MVLTNAAFALKIIDVNKTFDEAFSLAKDSLFGGKASQCLEQLISNC